MNRSTPKSATSKSATPTDAMPVASATTDVTPVASATKIATPTGSTRRRQRSLGGMYMGVGMLVVLAIGAILARFVWDANTIDTTAILRPPGSDHWFGTDSSGRDVLTRTLAGAAADLPLALGGTVAAMIIGTLLGLLASTRGRVAGSIMRIVDGFDAFPLLILILVIVQIFGGGPVILLVTIAILNIPRFIRLSRSQAMQIRESRYVFYSNVIGASTWHILRRHILPNISGAVISQAAIGAALALSAVGAMSFLGIGIAPPTPSWGSMVQAGTSGLTLGQWWPVLFPSLALVWCIVAFNSVADSLDNHFAREVQ